MSVKSRSRAILQFVRSHRRRTMALALFMVFALLNAWSFRHAWAMTHFSSWGKATIRPEEMSWLGRAYVLLRGVNLPRRANAWTPADLNLPFETHHVTTSDGVDLECWLLAHPEPRAIVVMFHGYGTSKARLLKEAQAFRELSCAVLLVDFRGSGGSTGNVTTLGMHEAADVAAACSLAQRLSDGRELILYGRSMGSVAILRAIAHEGVKPSAIIIECPFDRLLTTVEHRFAAMGLPSFPCAELLVFWGGIQHGMNGFAHNPAECASRVDSPALVMHGEIDKRVSLAEVQRVYAALVGEKQLEIFPDVGHESCYRTRPDLWKRHVAQFLDRHCRR